MPNLSTGAVTPLLPISRAEGGCSLLMDVFAKRVLSLSLLGLHNHRHEERFSHMRISWL